jgi:hypothetical protein
MADAPRPGWYSDPEGSSFRRYWNGGSWEALETGDETAFAPHATSPAPPGLYPDLSGGPERYWNGQAWEKVTAPVEVPAPVPASAAEKPAAVLPPPVSSRPGMYQDPENRNRSRYFDGTEWYPPGVLPETPSEEPEEVRAEQEEELPVTRREITFNPPRWAFITAAVVLLLAFAGAAYAFVLKPSSTTTTTSSTSTTGPDEVLAFCAISKQTPLTVGTDSRTIRFNMSPASRAVAIAQLNEAQAATTLPTSFVAAGPIFEANAPTPAVAKEFQEILSSTTTNTGYLTEALTDVQRLPSSASPQAIAQAWRTPISQWVISTSTFYTTVLVPLKAAVAKTCGASVASSMFP